MYSVNAIFRPDEVMHVFLYREKIDGGGAAVQHLALAPARL
jgi:hypothetical protein